jgi:hypothetical protein
MFYPRPKPRAARTYGTTDYKQSHATRTEVFERLHEVRNPLPLRDLPNEPNRERAIPRTWQGAEHLDVDPERDKVEASSCHALLRERPKLKTRKEDQFICRFDLLIEPLSGTCRRRWVLHRRGEVWFQSQLLGQDAPRVTMVCRWTVKPAPHRQPPRSPQRPEGGASRHDQIGVGWPE